VTTFKILRKLIKRSKYGERAIVTTGGEGNKAYADYYRAILHDPRYSPAETDIILSEESLLISAIEAACH